MSNYVSNHEKKNRIFAKRERELVHALKSGLSIEKQMLAAEKVRDAKSSVFKCRFAIGSERPPHTISLEYLAAKDERVREWLSMSTAEIIEMYRSKDF